MGSNSDTCTAGYDMEEGKEEEHYQLVQQLMGSNSDTCTAGYDIWKVRRRDIINLCNS
jgi:hypothetical protein